MDKSKLTKDYTNYKWSYGERAPKEDLEYLKVTCNLSNEEIAKMANRVIRMKGGVVAEVIVNRHPASAKELVW